MARVAPRVYVDDSDIARLEAVALRLPQDARVQVTLEDGDRMTGMVSATPTVQAFFDPNGREGMNALVRLEAFLDDGRPHPGGLYDLWLDEIRAVTRLANPSPPEPPAWDRSNASRNPNAPTRE
jgi:Protein of unknown function (DUF3247)